jgi:hypothetical protein
MNKPLTLWSGRSPTLQNSGVISSEVERSHPMIGRATTGFLDFARNDKLNHKHSPVIGFWATPALNCSVKLCDANASLLSPFSIKTHDFACIFGRARSPSEPGTRPDGSPGGVALPGIAGEAPLKFRIKPSLEGRS